MLSNMDKKTLTDDEKEQNALDIIESDKYIRYCEMMRDFGDERYF